ncbi:MAG TPA: replicative DNA helicase [Clostridiales bacterium]|jgi:replicative DNA helicase|nr:replicative DNA helicase [Clostridiales bacterium]
MNDELTRKLPFSMIAEQSLLGAILIDPESIRHVADIITADDFYIDEHRHIYLAMHELFMTDNDIDIVTLLDMLVKKGVYNRSGGEDYIHTIGQVVPGSQNIKDYARIIKEKSVLRQLIAACEEISAAAYSEQDQATNIIENAQNKIYQIAQGRDTRGFRHIRDVLGEVYANLNKLYEGDKSALGIPTGFSGLDNVLAGMGEGDLILIGSRPGMGKTSFVLNIASNVASRTKKAVCIFSLEMSAQQLVNRMISSEAMVDSYTLRTGRLSSDDWVKVAEASAKLAGMDILIDDSSGITATAMKAKLRRVNNLGLVIIDYLQLMQGERRTENKVQEVAEITRNMKLMAKDLGIPVICCAQLSRSPEARADKKPVLADLRDSGSIEQDADVVIFLYRDDYYNRDKGPEESGGNIVEVIVAKNRHGMTSTVRMGWLGQYTKYRSIVSEPDK